MAGNIVNEYAHTSMTKTVRDNQTIQSVVDVCPLAVGSLREGFTNSYVVNVPPGHEKEHYSLVRNANNAVSDKRNVKVIYEDNPREIFQYDLFDNCDSVTNWEGASLVTDADHRTEGNFAFKVEVGGGSTSPAFQRTFSPSFDWRKYQGIAVDIEFAVDEVETVSCYIFQTVTPGIYSCCGLDPAYKLNAGQIYKGTIFYPMVMSSGDGSVDFSSIERLKFLFVRRSGYTGTITAYADNIRLVRTFPCDVAVLRFDDAVDDQWKFIDHLESRGWKGSYAVPIFTLGADGSFTLNQLKKIYNNGHEVVNHSVNHPYFNQISKTDVFYNYWSAKRWFGQRGFVTAQKLFALPYWKGNQYLSEYVKQSDGYILHNSFGFPVAEYAGFTAPFTPSATVQKIINAQRGGIVQFIGHNIADDQEANFETGLQWIEEHFSKVMTFSEILEHMPGCVHKNKNNIDPDTTGKTSIMTDDEICEQSDGVILIKDPGGAARNLNPVKEFAPFTQLTVINVADAAETITFEPTFTVAGTHDGLANAINLTDSGESWIVNQLIGKTITNTTDGSSGTIMSNTATTVVALLSGGTDNDWDIGDNYTIVPAGLNQSVGQNERSIFVYDGTGGWLKIYVGS